MVHTLFYAVYAGILSWALLAPNQAFIPLLGPLGPKGLAIGVTGMGFKASSGNKAQMWINLTTPLKSDGTPLKLDNTYPVNSP